MGGEVAFTSHPNRDLLEVHDPERFGCSPCHNGNGVAITSVRKAHGYYKHWLWPMYQRANFEAGCQQCHVREIVTYMAPVLNEGREIFRRRGCMGCHRYEGFDREPEELASTNRAIREVSEDQIKGFQRNPIGEIAKRSGVPVDVVVVSSQDVARLGQRVGSVIRPALRDGRELLRVDSVGGTALLIRADLHRDGLVFPSYPYQQLIETEGLAAMARDMGTACWALPRLEVVHPHHAPTGNGDTAVTQLRVGSLTR